MVMIDFLRWRVFEVKGGMMSLPLPSITVPSKVISVPGFIFKILISFAIANDSSKFLFIHCVLIRIGPHILPCLHKNGWFILDFSSGSLWLIWQAWPLNNSQGFIYAEECFYFSVSKGALRKSSCPDPNKAENATMTLINTFSSFDS